MKVKRKPVFAAITAPFTAVYPSLPRLYLVSPKMDNQGSSAEALKLVPIPQLKEDFANFDEWDHAVFFHLSYYHLTGFARDHITPPHDYDEINRLNAGLSSCGAAAIMRMPSFSAAFGIPWRS